MENKVKKNHSKLSKILTELMEANMEQRIASDLFRLVRKDVEHLLRDEMDTF